MIGKIVSHYKIIEELGRGGMGVVYKAQDLKLDRFVALKFLPPHLTTDEEEKQRFIHEAKAASSLDHNNICAIYEIDETKPAPGEPGDGQLFISMAYYEGETLQLKIEKRLLKIEEVIEYAIQIAQGLQKAHEKDIVHRDIKPANIMFTTDGVVKILDFGLAKLSTQTKLTKEGTTIGTISYMSPEQTRGDLVDARSDIWSLGVILYEIITGQLPFKSEYESAIIYSIVNDTQEPVTALRTGVPMELERIINKCLNKNPSDRYQHIDELIVDLRQIEGESEPKSSQLSKGLNVVSPKKSDKIITFSAILLSIVVIIVAGYFFIDRIIETDESDSKTTVETQWENSIAVLPFADLSPKKDQEYFCDGMTEQILTNLSKLNKLKVTARTSVNKFRNTDKTIPEIGRELRVENILEGSVFKSGNRVRITAQLVNASDGSHIWAENYDRDMDNMFGILDDVSNSIATNLLHRLSVKEADEILTEKPQNLEAYEYFLKANYFYNKHFTGALNPEDFKTSELYYKKAIELDPNYAPSYAWLAELYSNYQLYNVQGQEEGQYYLGLQEKYINAGYKLNPNSAEVNRVKHWVHEAKNEIDSAYACIKKSLEINPNIAESNRAIGVFYRYRGLNSLSIKYFNRAIELDPLAAMSYISRGIAFDRLGKYTKAENDNKKGIELYPGSLFAQNNYFLVLMRLKRFKQAEHIFNQIQNSEPRYYKSGKALLHAAEGDTEMFINMMQEISGSRGWYYTLSLGYLLLGMNDEFFGAFIKASELLLNQKISRYDFLKSNPSFETVRSDPRFQEILTKHKELYEENLEKYGDIDM